MSQFAHFSDQELFQYLKSLGFSPGPITPSTRSVHEKRLATFLKTGQRPNQSPTVASNSSSPSPSTRSSSASRNSRSTPPSGSPASSNMTDDELFQHMKSLGLNPGPITPTTRSVYERKLAAYMREIKIPGQPNKFAQPPAQTESPTTTRVYSSAGRVSPSRVTTRVSPTVVVPVQIKVNIEHDQVTASKEDRSVPIKSNRPSGKYGLGYDEDDDDVDDDSGQTSWQPIRVPAPVRTPPAPAASMPPPTPTPTPAPKVHNAKDFPLEFKLIQKNFTPPDVSMNKSPSSPSSLNKKRSEEHSFSTYSFMRTNNFNSIPSPPYHPTSTASKYHESYIDNLNDSNVVTGPEAPGIKKRNLLPFNPSSLQPQEHHHHYYHHSNTQSLYPNLSQYQQQQPSIYNQPQPAQPRFNKSQSSSISKLIYSFLSQNWLFGILALFCIAVIYNFLMGTTNTHNPVF